MSTSATESTGQSGLDRQPSPVLEEEPEPSVSDSRPASQKSHSPSPNSALKVFVGGISLSTTEADLVSYFSKFGELYSCKCILNPMTGRSRGFGFISFKDEAGLQACMEEGVHVIDSKVVEVKKAVYKERPKFNNNRYGNRSALGSSGAEENRFHQQQPYPFNDQRLWSAGVDNSYFDVTGVAAEMSRMRIGEIPSFRPSFTYESNPEFDLANTNRKIFIGGLAHSVDNAALASYFEKFGPVVDAVVMVDKETERSRGFGFITFASEDSANAAKSTGVHVISGKEVEVKSAQPRRPAYGISPVMRDGAYPKIGSPHRTGDRELPSLPSAQIPPYVDPRMYYYYAGGAWTAPGAGHHPAMFYQGYPNVAPYHGGTMFNPAAAAPAPSSFGYPPQAISAQDYMEKEGLLENGEVQGIVHPDADKAV